MSLMRISQLAERTGVPASTLRFYETAGLLPAERSRSGHRLYGEDSVERLTVIGAAKGLGLRLTEIGAVLAAWDAEGCREVKAELRPRVAARLAEARRRSVELGQFSRRLGGALARLDAVPDRDGPCGTECGLSGEGAEAWAGVGAGMGAGLGAGEGMGAGGGVPGAGGASGAGVSGAGVSGAGGASGWGGREAGAVACSLAEGGRTERVARWREVLAGAETVAVPGGLRLTVPVERVGEVAGLAVDEQRCCPFFDFVLRLDGPLLRLEVRAPAEGAALLAEVFAPAP
ncbi:MerR family transcriptional regulator [Streptomyces sp. NPDC046887]|uniref:MerR family transcriptional regulator n=1 Tax=Streptomyces sp. NPDC046887 TaxID=3155472 RepID=UPI003411F70E